MLNFSRKKQALSMMNLMKKPGLRKRKKSERLKKLSSF